MSPHENISPLLTQPEPDRFLIDLVHDVRQPLSTIESLAFFIAQRLPEGMTDLKPYLIEIQQQVANANARLCQAVESSR